MIGFSRATVPSRSLFRHRGKTIQYLGRLIIMAGVVMAATQPLRAQTIFSADFNSQALGALTIGSAPTLPQSIIVDSGASVSVVASSGNLLAKPVLLHSVFGSLASVAFVGPAQLSSGNWRVSWDSAILGTPVGDPAVQANVMLLDNSTTVWALKYVASGQFSVQDSGGFHTLGSFVTGQSDHFDVDLHLDTGAYDFAVNGSTLISGNLAGTAFFDSVYFRSNGRTNFTLPDLTFDNLSVAAIPEPAASAVSCGAIALSAFLILRRRFAGLRHVLWSK
jgi:hypothetical protein